MTTGQSAGKSADTTTAGQLASTPVVALRPETSAMAALREMYRSGMHHLAVVGDDEVVGLVAAVDLLFGIAAHDLDQPPQTGELCRRTAPAVDFDDDAMAAAQSLINQHTDALLVMRAGEVYGVLTAVDLVRAVAGGVLPAAETQAER